MKICGISDIHGDLNINIPECDVLCICGDVINLNDQRDIPASKHWWETRFVKWVASLPCKKVIVIPGNHDFFLERMYTECWGWFKDHMTLLTDKKLEFLIDESFYYEDIHFYGTPWISPIMFQEGKWAFEHPDWWNLEDKKRYKYYQEIPKCDILLTHDNPFENEALGLCSFGKATYHLFGHWHDGEDNPLLYKFNCSILDNMYNRKKKFKCVIIDIMTTSEKNKIEQAFLDKILEKFRTADFIRCPESNTVDENNKKILHLLLGFRDWAQEDKPVPEDEIPWDTSADVLESAIITDFSD